MAPVSDQQIEPALHALLAGDVDGLRAILDADRQLADAVWNGNTLLEWATQPPHDVDPACIDVLVESGASLNRALGLAGCWNLAELCTRLIAAGADPASFCDADSPITPLESAAMHGSTQSADVLVEHGLHRPTLWLAAATGRLDLVTEWVSSDGTVLRPAGEYRPIWSHIGNPVAPPPTDDPAQILGEALTFAALNNRTAVADYLLDAGVSIDAAPYRGSRPSISPCRAPCQRWSNISSFVAPRSLRSTTNGTRHPCSGPRPVPTDRPSEQRSSTPSPDQQRKRPSSTQDEPAPQRPLEPWTTRMGQPWWRTCDAVRRVFRRQAQAPPPSPSQHHRAGVATIRPVS